MTKLQKKIFCFTAKRLATQTAFNQYKNMKRLRKDILNLQC